jgi:hypothetical protein
MMASRAGVELAHIMAVNSHFLQSIQVFSLQAPAGFKSAVVDRVRGLRNYPVLIILSVFKSRYRAVHLRVKICAPISQR